jgi:hypothetical protein
VAARRMLAKMGAGPSSVYTQKGTMKDVLARCLKKTVVQICTFTSVYILFCNANIALLLLTYLLMTNSHCLFPVYKLCLYKADVYFSQVKNKPWYPWIYTWFWHCREHNLSAVPLRFSQWLFFNEVTDIYFYREMVLKQDTVENCTVFTILFHSNYT